MSGAPRVFVITCPVPAGSAEHLRLTVAGCMVTAVGPDGFRHHLELPPEAAMERLHWQVYGDVLELRAPYRQVGDRGATSERGASP